MSVVNVCLYMKAGNMRLVSTWWWNKPLNCVISEHISAFLVSTKSRIFDQWGDRRVRLVISWMMFKSRQHRRNALYSDCFLEVDSVDHAMSRKLKSPDIIVVGRRLTRMFGMNTIELCSETVCRIWRAISNANNNITGFEFKRNYYAFQKSGDDHWYNQVLSS